MWVKKSPEQVFPQQPHKATEEDLELFLMPKSLHHLDFIMKLSLEFTI